MTYIQPGILRRYQVNNTNRAIDFFMLRKHQSDESDIFDMDQPYQRGVVWGLKRKRNLVKSLLMGVPVPAIVVNNRFEAGFKHPGYDQSRNWSYAVVDGKQRVSTILGFVNNEFSVPAYWWRTDAEGELYWKDLTRPEQLHFQHCPMPVAEGRFKTLAQEEELFTLINFGGLAQGEVDEDV